MENNIQQSIQLRREIITNHYTLPPKAVKKMEELFERIEAFAATCKDRADFEGKFINSPLSEEYNGLCAEFTPYANRPEDMPTKEEYIKEMASHEMERMGDEAKTELRGAIFRMMPEKIRYWMVGGIYKIPILGDILGAKNNQEQLDRFFGKRKE